MLHGVQCLDEAELENNRPREAGLGEPVEQGGDVQAAGSQGPVVLAVAQRLARAPLRGVVEMDLSQPGQGLIQDFQEIHGPRKAGKHMTCVQADRQVQLLGKLQGQVPGELDGLNGHATTCQARLCQDLLYAFPSLGLALASLMGCNVIISKNCGNWMLCNEQLLVEYYSASSFLDRISVSLSGTMADNMNDFSRSRSYQKLVETLAVIQGP